MRFEKLRISVGIAIVLFILVIGNIIVFGTMLNISDSKNGLNLLAPVSSNNKTGASQTNVATAQDQQAAQTDQQTTFSVPVVTQTFRTRAS